MPPQQSMPPINQPAPNQPYDFILRDPQASKRGFSLPGGAGPVKILYGLGAALVLIIIFVMFTGHGGVSNSKNLIAVAGRAQEIARVSDLVQSQSNDPNTQYLAETTEIALQSQQAQITAYLTAHKVKIDKAQLALYQDKNTDAQLTTAQQNNQLEQAYDSYLKSSLNTYETSLQTAAKGASKTSLAILQDASNSTAVLLKAPEVTSLSTTGS